MKPWKPAEELKWQLRIRRQNRTSNGPDEDYNWKRFDRNSKVFFCVRPSLPPTLWSDFQEGLINLTSVIIFLFLVKLLLKTTGCHNHTQT